MKYVKCISLFIVYPLLVLGIGFYAGVKCSGFFYPREENGEERESAPQAFLDGGGQAPELMGEDGAAQNEDIIVGEEASPVLPEGMENGHSSPFCIICWTGRMNLTSRRKRRKRNGQKH